MAQQPATARAINTKKGIIDVSMAASRILAKKRDPREIQGQCRKPEQVVTSGVAAALRHGPHEIQNLSAHWTTANLRKELRQLQTFGRT